MNHRPLGPLPPVKAGISPLVIALIAIGGTLVAGVGSCIVVGGLVLAAAADGESESSAAPTRPASRPAPAPAPAPSPSPSPSPASEPEPDADPEPASAAAAAPATASAPASAAGNWSCTASASVRVCGFANACNMQMVFGNGFGKDRFLAQMQAKNACEGMARAKGASAVCIVQCTVR